MIPEGRRDVGQHGRHDMKATINPRRPADRGADLGADRGADRGADPYADRGAA